MRRVVLVVILVLSMGMLLGTALTSCRRQQVESASDPPPPAAVKPNVFINPQANAGKIIYACTIDGTDSGLSDIWEADLETGSTKLLIPHTAFPKDSSASIGSLAASPNGAQLAIVPGSQFYAEPMWVWVRNGRKFAKISDISFDAILLWSPSGNRLLFAYPQGRYFYVYDAVTGKTHDFELNEESCYSWSPGDDVVAAVGSWSSKSVVYLQPRDGTQRRVLFKWPGGIMDIVRSPTKSQFALFDGGPVTITDGRGKHAVETAVTIVHTNFDLDLAYNRQGDRLAVLTSYTSGEPHVNWDDTVWSVNLSTMKTSKVAAWSESYLGIQPDKGSATHRELIGWMPDGRSILISAQTIWGGDVATDNREDRFGLYTYNTVTKKEKKLFDSGPGCLAITWHPGK